MKLVTYGCVKWRYDYFLAEGGHVRVEMQKDTERFHRFIEAFERFYERKPRLEDADGDFEIQVAQDMQMSVGLARYYLRLAAEIEKRERERSDVPRKVD